MAESFDNAWREILKCLRCRSSISTLTRKQRNKIIAVSDQAIVVESEATGTKRQLRKEEIQFAWEKLYEKGMLDSKDLSPQLVGKRAVVIAILAHCLPNVERKEGKSAIVLLGSEQSDKTNAYTVRMAKEEKIEEATTEAPVAEATTEEIEEASELEALRQEMEEAKAQAAEYLDGWQRARAEFANYKKRNEQERQELFKLANTTLITRLLPIFDDFERAFQTLPRNLLSLTWIDGVALIYRRLQAILEAEGLTLIETEGQSFDPLVHEAVTYEESAEHEEGQIIGEVQRGYKLGDRVLRPALVRVAKGKPASEAEEKAGEPD